VYMYYIITIVRVLTSHVSQSQIIKSGILIFTTYTEICRFVYTLKMSGMHYVER